MDKIFSEIKKAIEEEMGRQEGRPTSPRQPRGRDMSQYEEWLHQEQERLRGSGQPAQDGESARDGGHQGDRYATRGSEEQWVDSSAQRPRRDRQHRHDDGQRSDSQRAKPRDGDVLDEVPVRKAEPQRRSTQHQRSEARHERQSRGAYLERTRASELRNEITAMLQAPTGLRKAILLSEIVGRPVSMRRQDEHLIG